MGELTDSADSDYQQNLKLHVENFLATPFNLWNFHTGEMSLMHTSLLLINQFI